MIGVEIRRQWTRTCSPGTLPPLQLAGDVSGKAIWYEMRLVFRTKLGLKILLSQVSGSRAGSPGGG